MALQKQPLIVELASRIGTLGVEVGDIAGHLDEVTTRVLQQADWNAANSRHRRIFDDRAVRKVAQNRKPFLLQTYRCNRGGGKFVLMKDLSSPIFVDGRLWGAVRMGYQ